MNWIKVPASLLTEARLRPTAKVLWMASRLVGIRDPKLIEHTCALSRTAILNGMASLQALGWIIDGQPVCAGPVEPFAELPLDLLKAMRIGARAKVTYCLLQTIPGYGGRRGTVSLNTLMGLAHVGRSAVKEASRLTPLQFTLRYPIRDQERWELAGVKRQIRDDSNRGKALMQAFLSALVDDSIDFVDDSPGFMFASYGEFRPRLHRYYYPSVVFQFVNPDMGGATANARSVEALHLLTMGACSRRGVRFVEISESDLTADGMLDKIGELLPLRTHRCPSLVRNFLERVSRRYRRQLAPATRCRQHVS